MECPKCKCIVPSTETVEFSFNTDEEVEVRVAGKCPQCNTPYIWTDIYVYSRSAELELDE